MYNFATKIVRDTSRHYCRHSLNNYDVYGIFIGDETLENLTYGLTTYDLSYGCKGNKNIRRSQIYEQQFDSRLRNIMSARLPAEVSRTL